jgi:alpha-L-arabinofuranosidase
LGSGGPFFLPQINQKNQESGSASELPTKQSRENGGFSLKKRSWPAFRAPFCRKSHRKFDALRRFRRRPTAASTAPRGPTTRECEIGRSARANRHGMIASLGDRLRSVYLARPGYDVRRFATDSPYSRRNHRMRLPYSKPRHWFGLSLICWLFVATLCASAVAGEPAVKIFARPLHAGQISPMLFGNFIELLDDLVPGMWGEMLNDRGFEGVTPAAKWVYYDGSPTFCDRKWDESDDWTLENTDAFNGPRCARITATREHVARLTQSRLAVRDGAAYRFSAWLRGAGSLHVLVVLKSPLPDGRFADLASVELSPPGKDWSKRSAKLVVAGSSDQAVLELRVVGQGTVWADKFSLMPFDTVDGWRKDVVEAIRDAHPAVIRWGGSAVDPGGYRWKNGIGDRDRRVPFANTNWGRIDPNDVGIDEFCKFCVLAKAEPLVCVSFSDGAASAADLVQYCNGAVETKWGGLRAANGHTVPYRVKYWQLGNEISGDDDAYIKKCREFIRVMKQADPSIAILSSFPSQKVLDLLGRHLAYLAPHHYTRDLAACEADFAKLSRMIAETPGCRHLRLAVTEWNFTAGDWGLGRGKMLTLEGALWNARYLNLMCRHCDLVEIGCRSNMTNSFCSGIIGTRLGGLLKRPSYHVMKLYSDHALPIPLSVGPAPERIDVAACVDPPHQKVCLFAVNLRSEPIRLALDLADVGTGFAPLSAETVCDTRDMRQPDVMNHWSAPERVTTISLMPSGDSITLPALSVAAIVCGPRHGGP